MTSTLLIAPLAGSLLNFVNASFIVAGLLFIFAPVSYTHLTLPTNREV